MTGQVSGHITARCNVDQRRGGEKGFRFQPFKNKVSPRTQKQKEACNPGKIDKHTLAGQNEASAPSRLRGNHDISSIAALVRIRPPSSAIYPRRPLGQF